MNRPVLLLGSSPSFHAIRERMRSLGVPVVQSTEEETLNLAEDYSICIVETRETRTQLLQQALTPGVLPADCIVLHHVSHQSASPSRPVITLDCGLAIDPERRQLRLGDKAVALTNIESELVYYLCERKNSLVPNSELLVAVRSRRRIASPAALRTLIRKIRRKLDSLAMDVVQNVPGRGYAVMDSAGVELLFQTVLHMDLPVPPLSASVLHGFAQP